VIVTCRARTPAPETQIAAEVSDVLERRGALAHPPVSIAVSDQVALGIAYLFKSASINGQVLDRFARTGSVDSQELLEAVRFEQQYASPEGHAALHCLIGWVHKRVHRLRAD
jgi:hypothetical protein